MLRNVSKAMRRLHSEMPKYPNRNLEIRFWFNPWQKRKMQELDKRPNLDSSPSREGKTTYQRKWSRKTRYSRFCQRALHLYIARSRPQTCINGQEVYSSTFEWALPLSAV